MTDYKSLRNNNEIAYNNTLQSIDKYKNYGKEYNRVADVAKNVNIIIPNLDKKFEQATKLRDKDMTFLFLAVALQCIRQYVIGTITQRKAHNESDKLAHGLQEKWFQMEKIENETKEEYRRRIQEYRDAGKRYYATTEEIVNTFSVPYDIIDGTKKYGVGGYDNKGNGKGLCGVNHRYKTLGHDPLFGWVFGTANIMTNTMTNDLFLTFHVKDSEVVSYGGYDKTIKMLEHVKTRSAENMKDLGLCLIKQGLHIASDTYSKEGIMLPGTVGMNSEFANELASYGADFGNSLKIGGEMGFSILINQIIAMIHAMLFDSSVDFNKKLYSIRTKKIIMNSNIIAETSNVIAVGVTSLAATYTGNVEMARKSLNYLDWGGMIETIRRVVMDKKLIKEIKQEYIEREFYNIVMSEE